MPTNYEAIPAELRELKQWILWRYEDKGAKKPTKVPYTVNHTLASVTEPKDWSSFNDVVNVLKFGGYDGIGFVFTKNDPYAFIDLDDTTNEVDVQRQIKVFNEFDSYSERSPSGKGLHIIVKGSIPQGRRRSSIEIYSSERYATMTGDIQKDKPIDDKHELLNLLFNQMGGPPISIRNYGNALETESDEKIIEMALSASNGDKFRILLDGRWNEIYPSQSEADLAFIDIIAFYTQNRNQIGRIFHHSGLGKRQKATRKDYLDWMIDKSFDRQLPQIDVDGFRIALENKLATWSKGRTEDFGSSSLGSIPSVAANLEKNNGIISSGEEQSISKETLSKQQGILSQSKQETQNRISTLVSGVEKDNEMYVVRGSSHSNIGLSSYGPEIEGYRNIEAISRVTEQREDIIRDSEMHNSVQQLSQETTLRRKDQIKDNGPVAQSVEPAAHNGLVAGSNPVGTINSSIMPPPGLMGDIARFIYEASPRPVPEIAIAAAISFMAGICGRAYNVSGTGLNHYVLLLADTGSGKEAAKSGIDKLLSAVSMSVPVAREFMGPSQIASGQALYKALFRNPCFVSVIGEFGLRMQAMSAKYATSSEIKLKELMLDIYGKSGFQQVLEASVYADAEKNTTSVHAPNFSLFGESVPSEFYDHLDEDAIKGGLLPRFIIIEYSGGRVARNVGHDLVQPSMMLIDSLAALMANSKTIMANRKVVNVEITPEARKIADDFDIYADKKINDNSIDHTKQLWNRAHLKLLKLAALVAVGCRFQNPQIEVEHILWAKEIVEGDIRKLSNKLNSGTIGKNSEEIKQVTDMKRIIRIYLTQTWNKSFGAQSLHSARIIPHSYISARLYNVSSFKNDKIKAGPAVQKMLKQFVDEGLVVEVGRKQLEAHNTTAKCYMVTGDFDLNE